MALIKPFKGIRFNQSLVKNLGHVITPPYDVIDDIEQERMLKSSPYNLVRLEYGQPLPEDNEEENHYSRAAETLQQWLKNGILKLDSKNSYYLYEQCYIYNHQEFKRLGIIASLKLQPYSDKIILRHERTMSGPKADRMKLLTSTRTNISPIFTLFPDPDNRIKEFFDAVDQNNPELEFAGDFDEGHRLWSITDPLIQDELTAYLAPQPILIADGHHRYETALNFYKDSKPDDTPGAGYILTVMSSLKDNGLRALPTHRLLRNLSPGQKKNLNKMAEKQFKIIEWGSSHEMDRDKFLKDLTALNHNKCGFGLITVDQASFLVPGNQSCVESLPVSLLHEKLLKPALALGVRKEIDKKMLSYPHSVNTAIDAVISGSADAAFILETVSPSEVIECAQKDIILPQKTTFFYPKLPGGLVLYNMDLSY
ncbi:MAG: DUF1015 domain-containing protein [Bacillota bacterium]